MNEKYKQNFIRAGALAGQVRAFGKSLIVPGASYNEVIRQINQKIEHLGGIPAFPPQMALNHVAAHFLPHPGEDIIFSNQVVKLDIGVCYHGAIGDCAVTVDLSGENQGLIDAAEAALLAAEQSIKVGQPIREIGKAIDDTAESRGYRSIKNLCGHGLGFYKIHTAPTIPNYDDKSAEVVKPGMTFAVEPFVTTGKGRIFDEGNPTIFSLIADRRMQSELAQKLLAKIKTFKGLPFAMHDLVTHDLVVMEVKRGLIELILAGAIIGYAPLVEIAHGMVAQAENSILVDEKGNVVITTRNS